MDGSLGERQMEGGKKKTRRSRCSDLGFQSARVGGSTSQVWRPPTQQEQLERSAA